MTARHATTRAERDARRAAVAELVEQGLSDRQVAAALSISCSTVWGDRHALDMPANIADPDDVDILTVEIAVDGLYAGQPLHLTRAERDLAITQLVDRGHDDQVIAYMLNVSDRTVLRDRHRLGLTTPYPHAAVHRNAIAA